MKKSHFALYDGPMGWKWVLIGELAEMMGSTPQVVWEAFFSLSKDVDLIAVVVDDAFYNVSPGGEISGTINNQDQWQFAGGSKERFQALLKTGHLFVPAGWAQQVLEANERGVVRVVRVACASDPYGDPNEEECNPGTLHCCLHGSGFGSTQLDAVGLDPAGNAVV